MKSDWNLTNYTDIKYYPLYEGLDQIPFMEKMKNIFKTLRIATEDGRKIITLENLGEKNIKLNVNAMGVFYTLEIFDYDLESP